LFKESYILSPRLICSKKFTLQVIEETITYFHYIYKYYLVFPSI